MVRVISTSELGDAVSPSEMADGLYDDSVPSEPEKPKEHQRKKIRKRRLGTGDYEFTPPSFSSVPRRDHG